MHLSDGVVSLPVLAGGFLVAGGLFVWSAKNVRDEEIPRIAVFTAAFFVASLIHFKVPATSVHLIFNGLIGVVLGRRACLAFPIGLFLQAALLGHGGLSVLGVNMCIFAIPALIAWKAYEWICTWNERWRFAAGVIGGMSGVFLSGTILSVILLSLGEGFKLVAEYVFIAHLPIMLIEGVVTGFTVEFIERVQPALLRGKEL